MKVIDYDRIEEWEPWIDEIILGAAPNGLVEAISEAEPEYIEDAADVLYQFMDRDCLVDLLVSSLKKFRVRVYHGTRLSPRELADIKDNGLRPLTLERRKHTLTEVFKEHPEWEAVKHNLDSVLKQLGPGNRAGRREDGNIHVCFSKKGLLEGCSHYLTHGAEVDGHVAYMIFEDFTAAEQLLRMNRAPYLISFLADFESALSAANPLGFNGKEVPSLIKLIVESWAYRKYRAMFSPENLRDCTAAMFHGAKPYNGLENIEAVSENSIISY
ncbi:hypothetical protein KFJ24_08040 [Marinobacter sediminum]|uniref:hypothetical protein n=1 Tax=Marinobacter sediminum TaxID=256323 RepID=UPI00202F8F6B|nr:hypothetical protein [Marinobacter sediminum]MCM0612423.1 hypothetical protein [Marinobacter sediminum]